MLYLNCITGNVSEKERIQIFQDLKDYCYQDTLAEVKLIEVLYDNMWYLLSEFCVSTTIYIYIRKSGNLPLNNRSNAWLDLTPCFRQVDK